VIDHGPIFAIVASKASGPLAKSCLRKSWAKMTGITMYSTTDVINVSQGTVMAEMPSRKPTRGAKAITMMLSFRATCDNVNSGSPLVSLLHTNTIAVQGAAPSKTAPAT